ncbi:glutaredoxin family protein [Jeotgalibacillus sp. ET6]|uniref:glutaredoxin family protein n=1 Tax=Jeotgalibacillus sp. ET6 TaxID=3037260 RepID=UPI002418A194|nr:glutaredoxin family protein [Jeotgalibacillus sp. ET6]MDG5471679.1 glutaredoxin family protein [Jeotgalibacillus sp. ET6]
MIVEFYTRPDCPLCEEAKIMLKLVQEDQFFIIEEKNINERDEWTEEYGLMIPVIKTDGKVIQFGQVDYPTLSKRLQKNT